MRYFLWKDGGHVGPKEPGGLMSLLSEDPMLLVCPEGTEGNKDDWKPAIGVPEFQRLMGLAAEPPGPATQEPPPAEISDPLPVSRDSQIEQPDPSDPNRYSWTLTYKTVVGSKTVNLILDGHDMALLLYKFKVLRLSLRKGAIQTPARATDAGRIATRHEPPPLGPSPERDEAMETLKTVGLGSALMVGMVVGLPLLYHACHPTYPTPTPSEETAQDSQAPKPRNNSQGRYPTTQPSRADASMPSLKSKTSDAVTPSIINLPPLRNTYTQAELEHDILITFLVLHEANTIGRADRIEQCQSQYSALTSRYMKDVGFQEWGEFNKQVTLKNARDAASGAPSVKTTSPSPPRLRTRPDAGPTSPEATIEVPAQQALLRVVRAQEAAYKAGNEAAANRLGKEYQGLARDYKDKFGEESWRRFRSSMDSTTQGAP
jgi:hypothetical protein